MMFDYYSIIYCYNNFIYGKCRKLFRWDTNIILLQHSLSILCNILEHTVTIRFKHTLQYVKTHCHNKV